MRRDVTYPFSYLNNYCKMHCGIEAPLLGHSHCKYNPDVRLNASFLDMLQASKTIESSS